MTIAKNDFKNTKQMRDKVEKNLEFRGNKTGLTGLYLRVKKVNNSYGRQYHYLYVSRCQWDSNSGRPKQITVKYIGRLEDYSGRELELIKEGLKVGVIPERKVIKKTYLSYSKEKKTLGTKCAICNFDTVIHLHHIKAVSNGGDNSIKNLIVLCPNHHAMADRGIISSEELIKYKDENLSSLKNFI